MCCSHASTRSTLSTLGVYPNWNVLAWPLSWIDICCWSNCNPRTWCTNVHWLQESKVLQGQLQTYPAVQRATKYAIRYTISSLWGFHTRLVEERRQSTVKHGLEGVVNTRLFHLLVISQSNFKFFAKQNIFNSLYIVLNLQLSVNLSRTHGNVWNVSISHMLNVVDSESASDLPVVLPGPDSDEQIALESISALTPACRWFHLEPEVFCNLYAFCPAGRREGVVHGFLRLYYNTHPCLVYSKYPVLAIVP